MDLISDYEAIKEACKTSYNGVSMIDTEVLSHVLIVFDELKTTAEKFIKEARYIQK